MKLSEVSALITQRNDLKHARHQIKTLEGALPRDGSIDIVCIEAWPVPASGWVGAKIDCHAFQMIMPLVQLALTTKINDVERQLIAFGFEIENKETITPCDTIQKCCEPRAATA